MPWLTPFLRERRGALLDRWLAAAREQPFHRDRPERAVSDALPRLFDALVDDPAGVAAAQAHAHARAEQG